MISAKGAAVKLVAGQSVVLFIFCCIRVKRRSPGIVADRMKEKGMPEALWPKASKNARTKSMSGSSSATGKIDLAAGGKEGGKEAQMSLTECKTRRVRIRKLQDRTQAFVLKALRSLESGMGPRAFRAVFKGITADNGTEFPDVEALERSAFSRRKRTPLYYAHPTAFRERGGSENGNRMIRRLIPKGSDIAQFTQAKVREIQDWINGYPRKILQFK